MNRIVAKRRRRWPVVGLVISVSLLLTVGAIGEPTSRPAGATATNTQPAAPQPNAKLVKLTRSVPLPPLPAEVTRAFVIPIREDIFPSMADAIQRKLVTIKSQNAELVIFDFNTNGGRIDTADKLVKLIRDELQDVRTVAFVNSKAISAGSWLALTCDELVMVPQAKIGDSGAITMGGTLEGVKREKTESYLTADFRLNAEANGYWPALLESMVRMKIEVWLVENIDTGEMRYVEADAYRDRVANAPGASTRPAVSDAEWRLVEVAVPEGELLTATTSEAQQFGMVSAVVRNMTELRERYNITEKPKYLSDTWSENFVGFMTSPAITGLLVMLAMFFGYIEINTPGFGFGGIMALVFLAIMFGSRYLTGLAQWWEIGLFAVGVILVLLEVFVIPGFGVAGILGGILCLLGLLAILIGNPPEKLPIPTPGVEMEAFLDGLFALAVGFLAGCGLCMIVARYLPSIPIAGRLILAETNTGDSLPADAESPIRRITRGARGVTETVCRPTGRARFGDDLIDVVTEGGFLAANTPVVVQRNEGNRLVIEADKSTA